MKVAVLGGFGLMAEAALHDLAADPRVEKIYAADLTLARARQVLAKIPKRSKIKPVQLDLTNTSAAARSLKGTDAVLNCSWYEFNLKGMELALALKAHYVDLGGLYHMTLKQLKLDAAFRKAGRVAVLGCGSTPGITNMMVARMAPSFETIETVGIYDASHDPSMSEAEFLPPFSIRTMLDEYEAPAPVWLGGRIKDVAAHSGAETLEFPEPIGRVSAGTVIHSETATLPRYLAKQGVKNLFFKIVYPESVKRQLALLVGMGFSKDNPVAVNGHSVSPRRFVGALAQASALRIPSSAAPKDYEVLRVRITGKRDGRPLEKTWDCDIRPTAKLTAGAVGVGFAGAIAAGLCASGGTIIQGGAGAPESTLDQDSFFKELKARRSFSLRETIAHPLTV
jgi:lysine 6-dehydrogenase